MSVPNLQQHARLTRVEKYGKQPFTTSQCVFFLVANYYLNLTPLFIFGSKLMFEFDRLVKDLSSYRK